MDSKLQTVRPPLTATPSNVINPFNKEPITTANSPKTTSVFWNVRNVLMAFDSPEAHKRWYDKGCPIFFEFDAKNSDDYGKAVLKEPEFLNACIYTVTPEIAHFKIVPDDGGPAISAEIKVLLDFQDGLTQAELERWNDDLAGFATATISIDDEANWDMDEGSWFEIVHPEESMVA